jgi:hypothetical protein
MAVAGQSFQPIGTPVTFTGFSQETLNAFAPQLLQAGLIPVSSVGGAAAMSPMKKADATTLVGGDSVSMHLTRGDYSLAAAGTVTLRDGDKIYAFGHPFLSLGISDLPMSESHVVAVIPSVANSFKLAVPDSMVGTMTQDRATGVLGKLGQAPKMIPVRMEVMTSRGQKDIVNFEIAKDDFLTPLLLNIARIQHRGCAGAVDRRCDDRNVGTDLDKRTAAGQGRPALRRRTGAQLAAASVAGPVAALMKSRFEDST